MIQTYFDQLKRTVDRCAMASFVIDARISFEMRAGDQGYVSGNARHRPPLALLEHKHIGDTVVASRTPTLEAALAGIATAAGWA